MTIDGSGPRTVLCPACTSVVADGDRFCDQCGRGLPVDDGESPVAVGDSTTRRLCAGAHLDDDFCRAAIAEHLVERTRQIPESPGVDAAAVLRDAVAARRRRQLRDRVLLVLFAVNVLVSPIRVVAWTIVAHVAQVIRRTNATAGRRAGAAGCAVVLLFAVLPLGAFLLALFMLAAYSAVSTLPVSGLFVGLAGSIGDALWTVTVLGALCDLLILLVLLLDELCVDRLLRKSFRPGSFLPDAAELPPGIERNLRLLGRERFRAAFERIAVDGRERSRRTDAADVIVYRGDHPFVGAGRVDADETLTLPLTPRTADIEPEPFSAGDLHAAVSAAVRDLREAIALAPSERLTTVTDTDVVIVPVERLLTDPTRQPTPPLLAGPDTAPVSRYPVDAARALAGKPQEWARYYRRFRVEAWDRDLAVSTWFSVGTDDRMLHLEMVCTVLSPIDERFRRVDHLPSLPAALRALGRAVLLPATAVTRFRSATGRFRPLRQQQGSVVPERYGAGRGLRELAAGSDADFFQRSDIVRYEQVLRTTVLRAVIGFLSARGYSVADLSGRAAAVGSPITVVDNRFTAISGGVFSGPLAVGTAVHQDVRQGTGEGNGS